MPTPTLLTRSHYTHTRQPYTENMFHTTNILLLLLLFLLSIIVTTSSSSSSNNSSITTYTTDDDVNGGPLDWSFKEFLHQPDSGLLTTANVGLIVAFEDQPNDGVTWEASNQPSNLIRNGGKLIWTKKTNLLFLTPPSRTQSAAAMLSWNDGEKQHAGVMFGGLQTGHVLSDTWLYRKLSSSTAWYVVQKILMSPLFRP